MADQKINALPVKTSPTAGDKMLMIGAAEEYQIDYDQLATAILNKLTSKTFTLDQGTKSLVAALNELNSNMFYDHGDEISLSGLTANGFITGSGTNVYLPIPAGKRMDKITSATLLDATIRVRQNGNYIVGSPSAAENVNHESVSITLLKTLGCLNFVYILQSKPESADNNSEISAYFATGTIRFD